MGKKIDRSNCGIGPCEECPMKVCVHDLGVRPTYWVRDYRIYEAYMSDAVVVKIAAWFGIHKRSVYRALNRVRERLNGDGAGDNQRDADTPESGR